MRKIAKIIYAVSFCCIFLVSCSSDDAPGVNGGSQSDSITVILDTDLGNCTDDILAMQALFYMQQQKKCNVIGVMTSVQVEKARELADRFLHFFKADDVPLGILPGEEDLFLIVPYFQLVDSLKADGSPLFPSTGIPISERMPAWKLYRKLLAGAEDHSIVIICIGKFSNLGLLLDSAPDEYSPLSGSELISKKVKRLEAVGGCFTPVPLRYTTEDGKQEFLSVEYNVGGDVPLAKKVLENWPTDLCLLPIEEGMKYPSNHDEVLADYAWQPDHPMFQVYSRYDEWAIGDVGQFWWDAELVMHALWGESYFNCTGKGILTIDDKGQTSFTPSATGNVHVISTNAEYSQTIYDCLRGLFRFKP
ncbi:MAG: nucleoside hydrolase [Prevotella sp.]